MWGLPLCVIQLFNRLHLLHWQEDIKSLLVTRAEGADVPILACCIETLTEVTLFTLYPTLHCTQSIVVCIWGFTCSRWFPCCRCLSTVSGTVLISSNNSNKVWIIVGFSVMTQLDFQTRRETQFFQCVLGLNCKSHTDWRYNDLTERHLWCRAGTNLKTNLFKPPQ